MSAIPFETPDAHIPFVIMRGEAGGEAIRVLFDSGFASPFTVALSQVRGPALAEATGEPVQTTTAVAGGGPAHFTPARLPELRLGALRLTDVRAAFSPSVDRVAGLLPGGFDAIVGQDFAAGRVVAVDYGARTIDFAAAPGPGPGIPMRLTPKKPLPIVEATINEAGPFAMALDTGAGGTILSPAAADRAGLARDGQIVRVGGAGGVATEGRMALADLSVGSQRWPGAPVFVADLMGPVSAEAGVTVDGVLGAPLFSHGRLILDYPGRRCWIGLDSADAP